MPAVAGKLHKLVFGGILAGTESWACSIHFAQEDQAVLNAADLLTATKGPIEAWFTNSNAHINGTARLNFIKLNEVNKADGKYVDQGMSHTFFENPMKSPVVNMQAAPPQISIAVTWHTDRMRGRASKGRIYPPSTLQNGSNPVIDATGHVEMNAATQMASAGFLLLSGLNDALEGLEAVVWSQIAQEAWRIESVSVGRVADTQLRRRKALTEDRFTHAVLLHVP